MKDKSLRVFFKAYFSFEVRGQADSLALVYGDANKPAAKVVFAFKITVVTKELEKSFLYHVICIGRIFKPVEADDKD